MRKITLDITKLEVESFSANADNAKTLMECTERPNCTIPCALPTCDEYIC